MSTIQLTDTSSASANATLLDDSVIGKTIGAQMHFLRSDVIGALNQPLDQVQINCISLGYSFTPPFTVTGCTAKFTAGGGPTGELDLYKPAAGASSPLFKTDQFGTDVEMGSNYYLALSFQLGANESGSDKDGAYTLTPSASATANAKLYLPFGKGANGVYPTLQSALETLFGAFKLPSTTSDLLDNNKFPVGSVLAFDAQGTIGFKTKINLLTAINPTATPGICNTYGPISITAGPSVTIGGGFTLCGEIETRIWRKSANVVQIGYYKKQGSTFTVTFDAGAGADATVDGYDVIAGIYGLLGDSGKLDAAWLKTNVPAAVATDVQNVYKSAVQTKLSIAMDEECDTSITNQAAFSWNFDLSALDTSGQSALTNLLNGDLSALLNTNAPLPAGITKAGSILDRTTDVKHTFSFNFLGLFDHASCSDAALDMQSKVSDDGQLVITDKAHLTRLSADATPFIKSGQLCNVYAEDCVATIGYSASLAGFAPMLKIGYNYYSYKRKAGPADLQSFVGIATQLGEAGAKSDWSAALNSNSVSQQATFFATLSYDGASGSNLFLNAAQNPRSISDYQNVGSKALQSTPDLGLDPQFIAAMNDPIKWPQLIDAGSSQNFYQILGVPLSNTPQWAVLAFTWTQHLIDWASAMHSTSQALYSVTQYVKQHPQSNLLQDPAFQKQRKTFASQLQSAIQKAPLFDDALGLMTIFDAAAPLSKSVRITYAGVTKNYS